MRLTLAGFVVAFGAVAAGPADGPGPADSYLRIEVKGTLACPPDATFDPRPNLAVDHFVGPTIAVGQPLFWDPVLYLVPVGRGQFDRIKANRGRLAVVTGDLEFVQVPQGKMLLSPIDKPPLVRHVIRVREVRLVDQR